MKTLSDNERTAYLKMVMEVEASVITQQQILAHAERTLVSKEPQYQAVTRKMPEKPKEPACQPDNRYAEERTFRISIITAMILTAVGSISFLGEWKLSCFILLEGIVVILVLLLRRKKIRQELCRVETENSEQKLAYEKDLKQYEYDMEHVEDLYKEHKEASQKAYEEERTRYQIAADAVDQLRPALKQTQEILNRLYAFDILPEQYRTLPATAAIYEYISSGRVTELEGKTGAYSLYESELQQGLITDKLYCILSQPDDIKEHQTVLYHELEETEQTAADIEQDVSRLISAEYRAEDAAHIREFLASVQEQNGKALQYLEVM